MGNWGRDGGLGLSRVITLKKSYINFFLKKSFFRKHSATLAIHIPSVLRASNLQQTPTHVENVSELKLVH